LLPEKLGDDPELGGWGEENRLGEEEDHPPFTSRGGRINRICANKDGLRPRRFYSQGMTPTSRRHHLAEEVTHTLEEECFKVSL
jgi:hypothetical protein